MGSPETAKGLLETWISQYKAKFQPDSCCTFEASVLVDALTHFTVRPGLASFSLAVASPLLNNYKGLNGGAQAALTSIAAEMAAFSLGRQSALASISTDYLNVLKEGESATIEARAEPGSSLLEVKITDSNSGRLVSKSRCRSREALGPQPEELRACCCSSPAGAGKPASDCTCASCQSHPDGNALSEPAKQHLASRMRQFSAPHRADHCWNFDTMLGCELQDIATGRGWCKAKLPVGPRLQNAHGRLHAGCYPALVDLIASAALSTMLDVMSLSINIAVDCLADVPVGQAAAVEAVVVKAGRSLAFCDVFIRNATTGELVARGTHTEFTAAGQHFSAPDPHRVLVSQRAARL